MSEKQGLVIGADSVPEDGQHEKAKGSGADLGRTLISSATGEITVPSHCVTMCTFPCKVLIRVPGT